MGDIRGMSLASVMDLCTFAEFIVLRGRQQICQTLNANVFKQLSREEQRRILKLIFYRSFKIVIPDDEFYMNFPVTSDDTGDMIASMGVWEDTENSVVQVDVWCSDKNSKSYEGAFTKLAEECKRLIEGKKGLVLDYNEHKMIRFRVRTIEELETVIALLGGTKNGCPDTDNDNDIFINKNEDWEEFLRQIKLAINTLCSRQQISLDADDGLWNTIETDSEDNRYWANHGYGYFNDWAIQLYENQSEPMRGIDVFPKRGKTKGDIYALSESMAKKGFVCRAMKWDGRVFCRFPTPTQPYAKKLLSSLWEWRDGLAGQ